MSTHRTRNMQRQQQSGSSQQIINSPMTPPKTFGKGVIVPVIIDLILCIAVCVARTVINKNTDIHLPFRIVPLSIIAAIVIAVLIVVSYILKQYRYLRNTYQMLEQGMTVAAELNAHQGDFVEYSVNQPYYGNGFNNGVPFPQNQAPMPAQTPQAAKKSSGLGCGLSLILFVTVTIIAGMLIYTSIPQGMDVKSCRLTTGTVTEVQVSVYEDDEDTHTTYHVYYEYSYDGKDYEGHDSLNTSVTKGEMIDVVIDTSNPQYSLAAAKLTYYLIMWGIMSFIMIFIGALLGSSVRKR